MMGLEGNMQPSKVRQNKSVLTSSTSVLSLTNGGIISKQKGPTRLKP